MKELIRHILREHTREIFEGAKKVSQQDFIDRSEKIHDGKYDYSKVNYENTRKQVIIICKEHGEFKQTPNDHLSGYGCTKCAKIGYSKICIEWLNKLMKDKNIFIQHAENIGEKKVKINNKLIKFDGYCEKTNTVFELHFKKYYKYL
jgi:hypothetical protein